MFFIKLPPGSYANTGAQEAVEQYREHEQGEGHVQAIAFDGESYDGEGHAGDGSGNEEKQSELDYALASDVDDALDDSGDGAVFGGLAAKDAVIGGLVRMARQVDTRSEEDDSRRDKDSGAEQIAENDFDAPISPWLRFERLRLAGGRLGGGHQIFPQNPL